MISKKLLFSIFLSLVIFSSASAQKQLEMSLPAPAPALATSLPPQRSLVPIAPAGQPLKQGYFPGKDGVQLFYRITGSGKDTIVFVHSGPIGMEAGALDLEPLAAKGYTFISYDQRGYARSELVRDTSRLEAFEYVSDLEALRRHFNISRFSLIGNGWGTAVSLLYANAFPDKIKNLVFISPMNPTSDYRRKQIMKVDSLLTPQQKTQLTQLDKEWFSAKDEALGAIWVKQDSIIVTQVYLLNPSSYSNGRGSIAHYSPVALKQLDFTLKYASRSLGHPYDLTPLMKLINVPTLLIEGQNTKIAREATQEYVNGIKGSKLALIPNAGHMSWLDQPEKVMEVIDEFFSKVVGKCHGQKPKARSQKPKGKRQKAIAKRQKAQGKISHAALVWMPTACPKIIESACCREMPWHIRHLQHQPVRCDHTAILLVP